MISIKKYLTESAGLTAGAGPETTRDPVAPAMEAYRSALREMGSCTLEACPALGAGLKETLSMLSERLSVRMPPEEVEATEEQVRGRLREWGRLTARHSQRQTGEVKDLLLVLARTAESVGQRDQRCAGQITDVTTRLKGIASLDDLGEIRSSIEQSAAELKNSVERMTEETRQAIDELKAEVSVYQTRLEAAEEVASRDVLTGVRSRLYAESQIERRLATEAPFCVAILDINGFKKVNDELGHLVGDDLLKQFATELKHACRSTDVIGRWGGDEFILLLDLSLENANAQMERARKWVFGTYKVETRAGQKKLKVDASIGLAERRMGDTMKKVVDRADAAMYRDKAASRAAGSNPER
jgi:diguanylate cyclase (GGDEF)-like protein